MGGAFADLLVGEGVLDELLADCDPDLLGEWWFFVLFLGESDERTHLISLFGVPGEVGNEDVGDFGADLGGLGGEDFFFFFCPSLDF